VVRPGDSTFQRDGCGLGGGEDGGEGCDCEVGMLGKGERRRLRGRRGDMTGLMVRRRWGGC